MDNTIRKREDVARREEGLRSKRLKELSQGLGRPPADISKSAKTLIANSRAPTRSNTGTVWALLDTSGSMEGDPLDEAKAGLDKFCRHAISMGYRVGVIAFDDSPREVSGATDNLTAISPRVQALEAGGCTAMAKALEMAVVSLSNAAPERTILLVTDGHASDADEALAVAHDARRRGIDLITLGTETADHDFLRKIATRADLACSVPRASLQIGIANAARLLSS